MVGFDDGLGCTLKLVEYIFMNLDEGEFDGRHVLNKTDLKTYLSSKMEGVTVTKQREE